MNLEQAYIKSFEISKVIEIVKARLNDSLRDVHIEAGIEVPNSYDAILADNAKRKIAISCPKDEWIAIIESKEVNDYAMLLYLSKELQTDVLAVVQSDITGEWGFVEMKDGEVVKSYFSEDDEIEDLLEAKLGSKKISIPLYMFREVVKERGNGWEIIQK